MKGFFKKYSVFIGLAFIIFIIVFVFVFNNKHYDDSVLSLNYLLNDGEVIIGNSLPITDEVGKAISIDNYKAGTMEYVEFEVKSNVDGNVKYEVYLTKGESEIEVPVKFVKVYLTDSNDKVLKYFDESKVPTYYDLKLAETDPSGKLIYSGTIKNKGSQKFKLRMWVADTYELTPEEVNFSAKLNVKVK